LGLDSNQTKVIITVRHRTRIQAINEINYQRKDEFKPTLPPEAQQGSSSHYWEHVTAMTFSPDGKVLAAAVRYFLECTAKDKTLLMIDENVVRLWDASSGKELAEL